jgi:hypothetical protein
VISMLLTWVGILFYWYGLRKYGLLGESDYWKNYSYRQVKGKEFKNETIQLDGYEYRGCTFNDVTFVYEGKAPFRVISSQITGKKFGRRLVVIRTSNPIVQHAQQFVHDLYTVTTPSE